MKRLLVLATAACWLLAGQSMAAGPMPGSGAEGGIPQNNDRPTETVPHEGFRVPAGSAAEVEVQVTRAHVRLYLYRDDKLESWSVGQGTLSVTSADGQRQVLHLKSGKDSEKVVYLESKEPLQADPGWSGVLSAGVGELALVRFKSPVRKSRS